jgi:hypothetical protein
LAVVVVPFVVISYLTAQEKRLRDLAAGTIVVRHHAFETAAAERWLQAAPAAAAAGAIDIAP